jgi:hypothetical protein
MLWTYFSSDGERGWRWPLSANASSASARLLSHSSLRGDAISDAVSRAAVAAAFFASSAVLARLMRGRALFHSRLVWARSKVNTPSRWLGRSSTS